VAFAPENPKQGVTLSLHPPLRGLSLRTRYAKLQIPYGI